ncbi:hypothetical protein A3L22_21525 [Streptomyces griseus subsp. griseus]|nr:hypothetical protein A3L22_21525 [Streptomyces griseus subsp. griseus]
MFLTGKPTHTVRSHLAGQAARPGAQEAADLLRGGRPVVSLVRWTVQPPMCWRKTASYRKRLVAGMPSRPGETWTVVVRMSPA